MKIISKIILFITLISLISFADEYAVISNNKMKDLSITQIKAIFLKKITVIDNIKIIPVNLGARDPLRKKVDGAIGYINANNVDENVKVIYKWSD